MGAIYKKEMRSYFSYPLAYIFLAAFFAFSGFFFQYIFSMGSTYMPLVFNMLFTCVLFTIFVLTMGSFSDERRHKTDQALLTAPVSVTSIVLGKFFSALTVFSIGMVVTVLQAVVLSFFKQPDWLLFLSCFLGLFLVGAVMIAIGMFISSLTESQIVAAVITVAFAIVVTFIDTIANSIGWAWLTTAVTAVSLQARFAAFIVGQLDFSNIIFFLSIATLALYGTVRVVESKRWL